MRDISQDLAERLALLERELDEIRITRAALDERQSAIQQRHQALRTMLDWEPIVLGAEPAPVAANGHNPWVGVGLGDAVFQLKDQHPDWGFSEIRDKLVADGFDFQGKKPGNAVNMVLMRQAKKPEVSKGG